MNLTNLLIFLSINHQSLVNVVVMGLVVFAVSVVLKRYNLPYIVAYILAGILAGESGLNILPDRETVSFLGEFGLILLLFFIGMEISLPKFLMNWKVPAYGTIMQLVGSVILMVPIGYYFEWSLQRIIIVGFIISLSSSAVVIKLLQDKNEIESKIGQSVLSILIMQDILIVPLLIASNYLGGIVPTTQEITLQIIGGSLVILIMLWILNKKEISLPFSKHLGEDHELQVFFALIVCFGFALITSLFGLSPALGAFVGGMFVHASQSTNWIHDVLHSFRVIFVAVFFVSIGMMIDLNFLLENIQLIIFVLFAVFIGNHLINTLVLHYFGRNWKASIYGGALLAQVGELSYILASSALYSFVISEFEYQLSIIIISLTLLLSPFWIATTRYILNIKDQK